MKIDSIKTAQEFYDFADIWYQRTHKLRKVWKDKNQTKEKREKAFLLFKVMLQRVIKLTQIATKSNQPLPKK